MLVLQDLTSGNVLLTNAQKSQMNLTPLGWDNTVRSDCPNPYVCKNGSLNLPGPVPGLWTYFGIFKCTVPVVVVVNSGIPTNDIIDLVANAYKGAAAPVPSGAPQPKCPA